MASTADGSVAISVDLNVDEAEKEIARLRKRIIGLESELNENKSKKNVLVEKLKEAEDAYISLHNNARKGAGGFLLPEDAQALEQAEIEIAKIKDQIEKTDDAIAKGTVALDAAKRTQGEYIVEADRLKEIKRQEAELERVAEEAGRAYLQSISQNAEIADQHIIDLQNEIETLTARQSDLKQAGLGLGYQEYDQIEARLAEINGELRDYKSNLRQSRDAAIEAADGVEEIANASSRAGGFLGKLGSRIIGLAKRVFIFSLITSALRSLRTWLSKVIKTNDEANAAFARLKGALLTLAQPLVEVLIPALTKFANILASVISKIAAFVSALSGKTAQQSAEAAKALYEETEALDGVGSAAKDAAGSLAGFDEINKLSGNTPGNGDKTNEATVPDFTLDNGISDRLKTIADFVMLIGLGLSMWKIGESLPGMLGAVTSKLGLLVLFIGAALLAWNGLTDAWENGVDWGNLIEMIAGVGLSVMALNGIFGTTAAMIGLLVGSILVFITNLRDGIQNGVDWENLIGMVLGLAGAATALYVLFGPIAAGIALVAGGLAMLVTAFHDAMENGWNLQNTFLAIAALLATGLGFSFITGSVIPLLIAAIASLMLAMTVSTGHGEELLDGIRTMIEGFKDFFTGIFTGDMKKAVEGLKKNFSGLKTAVGAVLRGIRDFWLNFLDWLDEKTGGKLHGIIQVIKNYVISFYKFVERKVSALLDIFSGVLQFLSGDFEGGWETVWGGIKDLVSGVIEFIEELIDNVIGAVSDAWDAVVSFVTGSEKKADRTGTFGSSGGGGFGGGRSRIFLPPETSVHLPEIPALARGAVIPPNREFMAVLGDQKRGNNIEAPEDLIRKIVREESGGNADLLRQILQAIKDGHIIMVDGTVFGRTVVKTVDAITTQSGRFAFKF